MALEHLDPEVVAQVREHVGDEIARANAHFQHITDTPVDHPLAKAYRHAEHVARHGWQED